jgi:hypothetical protein
MIDLNGWHRGLHEITGAMALRWCRVTTSDLEAWSRDLRGIADEMALKATDPCGRPDQAAPPDTDSARAGHENR